MQSMEIYLPKRSLACKSLLLFLLQAFLFVALCTVFIRTPSQSSIASAPDALSSIGVPPLWDQTLNFTELRFDNETGSAGGCYVIPNYIHFVRFGGRPVDYMQMICILAAYRNQRPDKIFFHHDNPNQFTGKYWRILQDVPGFKQVSVFKKQVLPEGVFNQTFLPGWRYWHGSDVVRIYVLMQYGGIYLDNDCYVVRNLDEFRMYEFVVHVDQKRREMDNMIMLGHKDARFLKKYLEGYRQFDKNNWYYNAGKKPAREILPKEPWLVHSVYKEFGSNISYGLKAFSQNWLEWKDFHIIHLSSRSQHLFKNFSHQAVYPVQFNETNIIHYPITFREMAYDLYDFANVSWPRDRL